MDVDTKSNGHQDPEKHNKRSIVVETNDSSKDGQKQKRRRSRSRTPSSKADDPKTSTVPVKTNSDDKNDKDETAKEDDSTRSTRSKTQKDKDDSPKVEPDTKGEKNKRESSKKEESSSKKDKTPLKDASKKTHNSFDTKTESPSPKKKEVSEKQDDIVTPKKNISKELASSASKKEDHPKKDCTEEKSHQQEKDTNGIDADSIEMDPLFIPDEPEPELIFDENSDMESGKGSPIISRCITRRSLTRNIPTPKTPKSIADNTDIDPERASTTTTTDSEPTILINNDTDVVTTNNEQLDTTNASLYAEVGSDVTRMEYTDTDTVLTGHDSSYLETSRERSLTETLRCLSARRPIRNGGGDIRTRVLSKNIQERCDLNSYTSVVDQLRSCSSSLKRKGRSTSPDGVKKFKVDNDMSTKNNSSLFSSPLASLRSRFSINTRTSITDMASSTPKLLVYKDNRNDLHGEDGDYENVHGDDEKKSWCSLM